MHGKNEMYGNVHHRKKTMYDLILTRKKMFTRQKLKLINVFNYKKK